MVIFSKHSIQCSLASSWDARCKLTFVRQSAYKHVHHVPKYFWIWLRTFRFTFFPVDQIFKPKINSSQAHLESIEVFTWRNFSLIKKAYFYLEKTYFWFSKNTWALHCSVVFMLSMWGVRWAELNTCRQMCCRFDRLLSLHISCDPISDRWCLW